MEFIEYKDYSKLKEYLELQNSTLINKNFSGNSSSNKNENFKRLNVKHRETCDNDVVKQAREDLIFSNVDTSTPIAQNKKSMHKKDKNIINLNKNPSSNDDSNELSCYGKTREFVSDEEKIKVSDKDSVECYTEEDTYERYSHSKSNQLHSTQNSGRSQITFRDPEFFESSVAELESLVPENKHARFANREYGNPYLQDFDSDDFFENSSYEGTSSWVPARPLTGIWDRNKFFSSLFDT